MKFVLDSPGNFMEDAVQVKTPGRISDVLQLA